MRVLFVLHKGSVVMKRLTKTGAKEAIKNKLKVKRTKNHIYLMEDIDSK